MSTSELMQFVQVAARDFSAQYTSQVWARRPTTLSLLINDICNSRCQMCNIWQRKRDREFTPSELSAILQDDLFANLHYVGVSGGEPTLRPDMPELFRVLTKKRPRLRGTGLITNSIQVGQVVSRVEASAAICQRADLPFNVMVSLDGIGKVHDHVRGRAHNFDSAVSVIRHLRDHSSIPISIGCTITKDNLWDVDAVLDFCKAEGVYGRFRVAEFVRRLYNDNQTQYIRNFTDEEKYHLGLFFSKLEYTYEPASEVRRTYRSIRKMLTDGAHRSTGCPWHADAATLDSRGQLLYCAPKSPVLGDTLKDSAKSLFTSNLSIRRRILENDCQNCIHDYHAPVTLAEWRAERTDARWQERLSLNRALRAARRFRPRIVKKLPAEGKGQHILIVGWYGTETAGDKAILGQLLFELQSQQPRPRISLMSLYPFVTHATLQELGQPDIEIVSAYSQALWDCAANASEVIIGGGPLMHIEPLGVLLWAFLRAKGAGRKTRVAGCGLGPLDRDQSFRDAAAHILRLGDVVELRDTASVAEACQLVPGTSPRLVPDLATGYVRRWMSTRPARKPQAILNLCLREWTTEYQGCLSSSEFINTQQLFLQHLGIRVRQLCTQFSLRPRLLPMHHFCIGNDDRDINRRFADQYLQGLDAIVEGRTVTLNGILEALSEGAYSVCMRFHAILFASTLGVPFLAIDYTNGGKIAAYLSDQHLSDHAISLHAVAHGHWPSKLPGLPFSPSQRA